jgi:two-component system sensor histidine kinase QseC
VTLAVATSNQPYLDQVSRIWVILGAVFLGLILALTWVVRRSLRVGLEPLADIREKIMALDSQHLDQRISPKRSVKELQGIVDQTNALLGRIENTFARERQFSHDIAHELRTPLAELRNLAEVGSRWPGDEAMVKRFFDDAIAATSQMELTLTSLLTLARADGNQEALAPESFDLVALVGEVRRRVCASTGVEPDNISMQCPPHYLLFSARHHWLLIVQNLLNNAVSHGVHGEAITITLALGATPEVGDVLWFENRTNELESSDLNKLFDRLWRKETARSQREHVGLGLSLVKAYAQLLNLTVVAELSEGRVFRIAIKGFHQAEPGLSNDCSDWSVSGAENRSLDVRPGLV